MISSAKDDWLTFLGRACISEGYIKIIKLNCYFHTSLWCLKANWLVSIWYILLVKKHLTHYKHEENYKIKLVSPSFLLTLKRLRFQLAPFPSSTLWRRLTLSHFSWKFPWNYLSDNFSNCAICEAKIKNFYIS